MESGILGHWDGIKKVEIEGEWTKDEPLTTLLDIKVESPPTPSLHYPPSYMSSSHFGPIDPNDFVWSPQYAPSP